MTAFCTVLLITSNKQKFSIQTTVTLLLAVEFWDMNLVNIRLKKHFDY